MRKMKKKKYKNNKKKNAESGECQKTGKSFQMNTSFSLQIFVYLNNQKIKENAK